MKRFARSARHARSDVLRPHASFRAQRSLRTRAWTRFGQSRARRVVIDRVAHWDSAAWPRGDYYTLFARAAFKGSGSSRATTVGFALEGRGDGSPAPTMGGPPEGRRGLSGGSPAINGRDTEPLRLPFDHKEPVCFCAGLTPLRPHRGGNRSDAAVLSPHPSLRWLRSEANPLPRSAPDLAVGARNGKRPTALNLRATDGNRLPRSRARLHHRATLCRSHSRASSKGRGLGVLIPFQTQQPTSSTT